MSHFATVPFEPELCLASLSDAMREATFEVRLWGKVAHALAEPLAPGGCHIAFHPHHSGAPTIRLNPWSAVSGATDFMASPHAVPPSSAASLTLARTLHGVWRIELWSNRADGGRSAGEAQRRLAAAMPTLLPAFRTCLALQGGGELDGATLSELWDPLPYGIMLLDPTLRLRFANMTADDLLHTRTLFRPFGREGRVQPALGENFLALTQACEMLRDGAGDRVSFDMASRSGESCAEITVISPHGLPGLSRRGESGFARDHLVVTLRSFAGGAPARLSLPAHVGAEAGRASETHAGF
ncbi:hypothetical protein [Aureimonas ureilytica]|uniref:hypothetical protein n=1 Tax=Aureimonas ureilytica TaxID=401562 RepID=UPI00039F0B7C|nr:hypothetical protein [Aureimonas ureilytica]